MKIISIFHWRILQIIHLCNMLLNEAHRGILNINLIEGRNNTGKYLTLAVQKHQFFSWNLHHKLESLTRITFPTCAGS